MWMSGAAGLCSQGAADVEDLKTFLSQVNFARYEGGPAGHYESFFQRANHPTRPLAFWIRYTLFSPQGRPAQAVGELWAVCFNGETGQHLAAKQAFPLGECAFSPAAFAVQIGGATLDPGRLSGIIHGQGHTFSWELAYGGGAPPLLLLPVGLYPARFPAAKSLVGQPLAIFNGTLALDGEPVEVAGWQGSQNHNWGRRHTDRYAWGQVAGFDSHPQSFLELATAQLKAGPFWTPPFTPVVLRHQGVEYALNSLSQSLRAQGAFDYFTWRFRSTTRQVEIEGFIEAPRSAFIGLRYANPPGGAKDCLNTKIAACRVQLRDRARGVLATLETGSRAAFEILTDDVGHGVPIAA